MDPLQQLQRLFVGLEGDREVRLGPGPCRDPAIERDEQAPDHAKVQLLHLQQQGVFLLGDLVHAHGGGLHPDEGDIDQIADRGRRVAVAVNELVQHIGGVLGGLDGGNAFVGFDAARPIRDILFGDERVHPQVHQALALVPLERFALGPGDGLIQHLDIEVIAHGLHVAVLAVAQQAARTANLQIAHGDAETGAERGELPDGGEPLLSNV